MASVAIVGAGPAGLFAAERLAGAGHAVTLYERMASPARKFLLAGRGGLNLTHSEPEAPFLARYAEAGDWMAPHLAAFPSLALRDWADGLGAETFVGSSGRVFPRAMKASPLLRAWLRRLDELGVRLAPGTRWLGWTQAGTLRLHGPEGETLITPDATLLALGGASWPRLGSDGGWVALLAERGVVVEPLVPANAGVLVDWSQVMKERFAGAPLKRIVLRHGAASAVGEAMIDPRGLEGGAVYALGAALRASLASTGHAEMLVDLRPDLEIAALAERLAKRRKGETLSNHLRKAAGLSPVAVALLRESGRPLDIGPNALAALIKAVPLTATGSMPIERAISTAGGIALSEVDEGLMLKRLPGVFVAGEMLDWAAPTGGYLLQGCLATGAAAAGGIESWFASR